jgi:hypothetical protein
MVCWFCDVPDALALGALNHDVLLATNLIRITRHLMQIMDTPSISRCIWL